mmetsp:Transcript_3657/g.11349  ORF Transcript_3657/g.11349 Transcript_3657/m.11349 type:complete len:198 (+) Transcript_3657:212-805(+)
MSDPMFNEALAADASVKKCDCKTDYSLGRVLGKGAFAKVHVGRRKAKPSVPGDPSGKRSCPSVLILLCTSRGEHQPSAGASRSSDGARAAERRVGSRGRATGRASSQEERAIKVIDGKSLETSDVEALHLELQTMRKVQHPNIVALRAPGAGNISAPRYLKIRGALGAIFGASSTTTPLACQRAANGQRNGARDWLL